MIFRTTTAPNDRESRRGRVFCKYGGLAKKACRGKAKYSSAGEHDRDLRFTIKGSPFSCPAEADQTDGTVISAS
jgi:hypothetical protein